MESKTYTTKINVDFYPNIQHEDICGKIKSFSELKDGWDYGVGYGVTKEVIENSCFVFNYFHKSQFKYSVNPTSEGGVKITAKLGVEFIDITVKKNLTYDLTHEVGLGSEYDIVFECENTSMNDIEIYLNEVLIKSCFSLERYTSGNIIQTSNALTATHLETTKAVFPLLTESVLYITTAYVLT